MFRHRIPKYAGVRTFNGDSAKCSSPSLSIILWSQEDDGEGEDQNDGMDPDGPDILDHPAQPSDKPRITTRYMTKYERARILGTRALQIR